MLRRRSMGSRNNHQRKAMFRYLRSIGGAYCGICGEKMNLLCARTDPEGATIDHIVPRAEGGTDSRSNLRLAHKRCNENRGRTLQFPEPSKMRGHSVSKRDTAHNSETGPPGAGENSR
jgi:5-methylcytosine-specific restriction endonuclease McrA